MDQPIRPKTEAEIEADRVAEEQAHSALSAVVGEREAASGISGE